METWQWSLVGAALVLLFSMMGYLYYRFQRNHSHLQQQIDCYQDPPTIIIDGDDKTPPPYQVVETNHLQDSRSTTPHSPGNITSLSAPPAHFFRDRIQSRWMPTKSPSPSSVQNSNTDGIDNTRTLSLSPFLGNTSSSLPSPSPVSNCSVQTRTPSPIIAKLATSWSTWRKHS